MLSSIYTKVAFIAIKAIVLECLCMSYNTLVGTLLTLYRFLKSFDLVFLVCKKFIKMLIGLISIKPEKKLND